MLVNIVCPINLMGGQRMCQGVVHRATVARPLGGYGTSDGNFGRARLNCQSTLLICTFVEAYTMMSPSYRYLLAAAMIAALCSCSSESAGSGGDAALADADDGGAQLDTTPSDGGQDSEPDDSGAETDTDTDMRDTDAADGNASGASGCELAETFEADPAYPVEWYVAPDGDDSNTGMQGEPFATLSRAASEAVQGTTIHLAAGTYDGGEYIGDLHGTEQAPIHIIGEDGAVIEGGNNGLQLSQPRYVILENLTFRGAAHNGLNIDDGGTFDTPAQYVVLRNIIVEDVGDGGNQDCIKLSGIDDFWVLDSDVSGCSGQGIDMVGGHRGVLAGNYIHDKPSSGIQAKGGSSDLLIHGNRFSRVGGRGVNAGGSTGLQYFRPQDATFEGARIDVVANVFEEVGAESGAPIAFVGCDACTFAHNTVIEPQTWVARILQETVDEQRFVPSRDGRFVNNIVVFNMADIRGGTFVNVGPNTAPETFEFANNLWFALDDDGFAGPSLSGGIPPAEDSVVQQDPNFADLAGGDYRIDTNSPAVGAGRAHGEPWPDFDGHCYEDPPEAGAFSAP